MADVVFLLAVFECFYIYLVRILFDRGGLFALFTYFTYSFQQKVEERAAMLRLYLELGVYHTMSTGLSASKVGTIKPEKDSKPWTLR